MQPEFWHKRWERGEIGWHQGEINAHLRELWPALSLPRGSRILVPLCGKSLDLLWLASQGHRVLGVEISQVAVEAFFSENGLTPSIAAVPAGTSYRVDEIEILCGDFFALEPEQLGEIGAVYDRAALIAFPPEVRAAYSGRLDRLLPSATP
jgi:thiopurine S-methyltransferase